MAIFISISDKRRKNATRLPGTNKSHLTAVIFSGFSAVTA